MVATAESAATLLAEAKQLAENEKLAFHRESAAQLPSQDKSESAVLASHRTKASIQLRLGRDELDILEQRAVGGLPRAQVLEDALRSYLALIEKTGELRPVSRQRERRAPSQWPARRYEVAPDVMRQLTALAARGRWPKTQLIRQAILYLGMPGTRRGRAARARPRDDAEV